MVLTRCKCGAPAELFRAGSGIGARCTRCKRQYTHPAYTDAQIVRVWNYANSKRGDDDGE